jgi:hypothetical protein
VEIKPGKHFLASGDVRPSGLWYRVDAGLHVLWYLSRRRTKLTLDGFKGFVASKPGKKVYIAITYAPDAIDRIPDVPIPDLVAWRIAGDGVEPLDISANRR